MAAVKCDLGGKSDGRFRPKVGALSFQAGSLKGALFLHSGQVKLPMSPSLAICERPA